MSELIEVSGNQLAGPGRLDSIDLKVKLNSSSSTRNKVLYGNGRMQVKVQVLVSGYDENGDRILVPREVMNTVELIHYNTGRALRDGWSASIDQGRYTLEAPVIKDEPDNGIHPQVCTFWVSSSGSGSTQIAASVFLNGVTIRSNATGLSGFQDSSVTLDAQVPVTYSVDQFRWTSTRRGNEEPGNRIWNYYLGLVYQGQQINLVDWVASKGTDDVMFAYGNWVHAWKTNYLKGVMVRPNKTDITVALPVNDNTFVNYTFRDHALDSSSKTKEYVVIVNDRHGELTVVQALSEFAYTAADSSADGVFPFAVIDQYGTEHKLAIRTDSEKREFFLERG